MSEATQIEIPVERRFRGIVRIDIEMCKGCGFCVDFCPSQVLEISSGFNSKGYHTPVVSNADACTGANLCGAICPDFAIFAWRERIPETSRVAQ